VAKVLGSHRFENEIEIGVRLATGNIFGRDFHCNDIACIRPMISQDTGDIALGN
jgi:hypothetical protein